MHLKTGIFQLRQQVLSSQTSSPSASFSVLSVCRSGFFFSIPAQSIRIAHLKRGLFPERENIYRSARITRCAGSKIASTPPPLQPKRLGQISSNFTFRWQFLWRILSGAPARFSNFLLEAEIMSFIWRRPPHRVFSRCGSAPEEKKNLKSTCVSVC